MPITDPAAVKYSNEQIRVSASRMANSYYVAKSLAQRWVALGSGQPALDALRADMRAAADHLVLTHKTIHQSGLIWQGFQSQAGAAPIENTGETIVDGSATDGRPQITGAQANNIVTRLQEYLNWGDLGAFTASANKGGGGAWLYTISDVGNDGRDPDLTTAGNFITRCNDLVTDYEAGSNAKLNTILAVAPAVDVAGSV